MALLTLESYDYSEDYLKDIEIEHFDESMSNMDCCMYIIAEGERMWNDIMKEMAVKELRHLYENGTEMIYEAADTDNFFTKIINWFKKIASNIAGWIQKTFRNIQDHLDKFKKYAKKYEKDIKKGYDLIPADGIEMKKFYKFENLNSQEDHLDKFKKKTERLIDDKFGLTVVTNADPSKNDTVKDYLDMLKDKSNIKSSMNELRASYIQSGAGTVESKDFKKGLKDFYYGTEIKDKVKSSDFKVDTVLEDLQNCTTWKREVADAHKQFKKYINEQIGKVKGFKKAVDKSDALKEAKLAYFKNLISVYKQCVSVATVVKSAKIGAFGQRAKQSLVISKKLVALAKKDEPKKEEKTNESFTYQFESGMNFFTSDLL